MRQSPVAYRTPMQADEIRIKNEFAEAAVRKVETAAGERLEIESPRRNFSIRLDATVLESLSWQDPSTFSEFLENPTGPT